MERFFLVPNHAALSSFGLKLERMEDLSHTTLLKWRVCTLSTVLVQRAYQEQCRRADSLRPTGMPMPSSCVADMVYYWFFDHTSAENLFTWRLKYRYRGCAVSPFLPADRAL